MASCQNGQVVSLPPSLYVLEIDSCDSDRVLRFLLQRLYIFCLRIQQNYHMNLFLLSFLMRVTVITYSASNFVL